MAMRQFGKVKGLPRPKTPEDWHALHLKQKNVLPRIQELRLEWSQRGPGQTGIRYFKSHQVPSLQYWNKELKVECNSTADQKLRVGDPLVTVRLIDQQETTLNVAEMREEQILEQLKLLNDQSSP
eukprot:CAMPEP_0177660778 /NCGR_PEP_ID=MMETSP0447-20121125/18252_1 /TAXON_ID=0 /ORGANISM="Stygamoeba regulata, Strain BSH-02190019" /LENGTH=124 /DNA_ID=CAMNT_0019165927 /DNA_START=33 /DNA_END=404 /DNA_ORIENTATION=-